MEFLQSSQQSQQPQQPPLDPPSYHHANRIGNFRILDSMRCEIFISYSADKAVADGDAETYATEYLNTVNIPNLPPHQLELKIGKPVILLLTSIHPKDCAMEPDFVWLTLVKEL